ncbi:MAG: metallophosphoesterase [Bacteroidota bacterium]|nr:metallophosphoesterase [Odoribacter sp.]MDP3643543.1 metallophosphoesterase [Bacteroidota bacterium]
MRVLISSFLFSFFVIVFLIELISYFGIRVLVKQFSKKLRAYLSIIYIIAGIVVLGLLLYSFSNPNAIRQSQDYSFVFFVISISILYLLPISFLAFMTILSYLVRWVTDRQKQSLILAASFLISTGIFMVIAYGILLGKYNLNVVKHELCFPDLPEQLNGLKIVQISDFHLGTFGKNPTIIKQTLDILLKLKPDILFFTGDIVNNLSNEMDGFEPYLKQFPALYGKFAIQGNHDYGDYSQWPDSASKLKNLALIRKGITDAGFDLLLNRWTKLKIKDTSICIIGVENWGHPPFPQYARLDLALDSIPANYFKILLSHDPAHWQAKVVPDTDIPLTLSGHTHGGQLGIKIAGIEFSPIYFFQKNWGGLYQADNQFLYVNRGLGCIGLPARIEMRPEITVLTLRRTKSH